MIKAERINLKKCQKCHHPLLYPTPIPRILGLLIFYIWSFQRPDSYISALEERVKVVEDKFEIVMNEHADKVKETFECSECDFVSNYLKGLNVHKSKKHKSEADLVNLNCLKCNFEAENEDMLKVHNIRKHTDKAALKYPNNCHINCHICEYELKTCQRVRIHMDIHALEKTIGVIQCTDCRFIGDSIETMEVHFG